MKLLFLDTETTGNDLEHDRLCQICYKNDDGIVTEYFKPPVPISVKSMSITHITNKMVEDKPAFKDAPMKQELQTLLNNHALVAHNAQFDVTMLEKEDLEVPHHICSMRVARFLDEDAAIPEYNLQFLRYYLSLEVPGVQPHDAEGDVLVLEAVFNRLLEKVKEFCDGDEEKAIQKMIEVSNQPSLIRKMPFGKYKDQKLENIAAEDPGYLEWLLKQKEPEGDEDWIHTLTYFLKKK